MGDHGQLAHRAAHVVRTSPCTTGWPGPFTLLDFNDMQSIGRVEYPDGAVYVEDYHAVAGYHHRRKQPRAPPSTRRRRGR